MAISEELDLSLSLDVQYGIGGVLLALQFLLILRPCFLPKWTKLEFNFYINLCLIIDDEYLKPIILESEEIWFKFTQYNGDCNLQTKQRPTCHVRGISCNKYLITTILLLCNNIQLNPGPCKDPRNLSESLDDHFISLNQLKHVKGLTMIHLNIRSLLNNIEELRMFINENKPDVVTLSETWLDKDILDEEININQYNLERKDHNRNGGGTAIYIQERLLYQTIEVNDLEIVLCSIRPLRSRPIIIGSVYRSPNNNSFKNTFVEFMDKTDFTNAEVYLLGDFNYPIKTSTGRDFTKLMNDLGYTQLIKEDTRVTQTSSNLIDLIFTNSPHRVTQSGMLNVSLSDHYMIFCNRTCKLPRSKPKVLNVRSFKNFNPTAFQDNLRNLPWDIIHLFDSPEDAWFAMEQLLADIGNKHAPLRTMRVRSDQPR